MDVVRGAEQVGRAVQAEIYRRGALGRVPVVPTSPDRLEAAARRRMSERAWAYVAGGAGQQRTVRANREALDPWRLSNHGGRQVDGAIGALDALPGVVAEVAGRVPVLFDSGVRSGADAFTALALGARAVLVARPYVYGLAIAETRGVVDVLRAIWAELDLTMALTGCATISDITSDLLAEPGRSHPTTGPRADA